MKRIALLTVLVAVVLLCANVKAQAQATDPLRARVNDLVHKHYMDGIQYADAKALGPEAVPYLVELLNDPAEKEYWVNIIVTLGFIEESSALKPLISFVERTRGEVDGFTLRAVLSVPFAVGGVASNGDPAALRFLIDLVRSPAPELLQWSFKEKRIEDLLAKQAVTGLAVSGREEARAELQKLKGQLDAPGPLSAKGFLMENVDEGLAFMDRMRSEGRSRMFNPVYK